ncbi:HD-GYP domain-containing protein [Paenibacillus sp.]|uniref:HD-GYP domain-containing protein n=1 Tax=Paenibacillus sp. TaxID=58172 RepID=UPI002D2EFC56|nr:HD-GYP domain-containing protein [Paenibacillus sp.]HZG84911.1 HD-GYP domain-containing protein [Paenibacillus sp.]
MVTVAVSVLKSGERLIEEVRTSQGGVLMEKGKVLSARDLEVLKAFLIKYVAIDAKPEDGQEAAEDVAASKFMSNDMALFYQAYEALYQILKKAFRVVSAGSDQLPLLEMRTHLEQLLSYVELYNPLTFTARRAGPDDYLIHNGIMVGLTSYLLARWHGMQQRDWIPIALSGILHDIGTTRIDDAIVNKPSKLTASEFEDLKKHTIIGYNILKNIPGINEGVKLSALQHHERLDGSGYPLGVKGEKIHVYAKLIAVTDVFHAMTTSRQYKKASSPYLVLEQLRKDAFGKLEPVLVQTFIQKVTQFHNGTIVRLNDGTVAEIVFTDPNNPTRPMVSVNGQIINLAMDRERFIQEVISY